MELEAEVVHLTEERNRERQKVKAGAKSAGLFKAIVAEMEQRVKPYTSLPTVLDFRRKAKITEHCVMHLSDGHHDQVVRPEEVGGLEDYSFPVSCARAERYVDTVVEWTQDTLTPKFYFPVLWVLAYGDYTSGEIHKACERSYYRNQFRNCLAIGQLHALMYRDLARPLRASPRPVSGREITADGRRRRITLGQTTTGTTWSPRSPACTAASWKTSTSPSPMRGAPTSISTVLASTCRTATMCAATWASPGTAWSAGKRV